MWLVSLHSTLPWWHCLKLHFHYIPSYSISPILRFQWHLAQKEAPNLCRVWRSPWESPEWRDAAEHPALTCEGVTEVNLVSEWVAQLHAHELLIPRPLDVLFALTLRVRVGVEGPFSPYGISACCVKKARGLALVSHFGSWRGISKAFKKAVCKVHCQPADAWFSPVLILEWKNTGV